MTQNYCRNDLNNKALYHTRVWILKYTCKSVNVLINTSIERALYLILKVLPILDLYAMLTKYTVHDFDD